MNLDKQSVIAVILGGLALVAWYVFGPRLLPPPAREAAGTVRSAEPAGEAAVPEAASARAEAEKESVARPLLPTLPEVVLEDDRTACVFAPLSGTLERVVLKHYLAADRKTPLTVRNDYPGAAGTGVEYGAFGIRPAQGRLTVVGVMRNQLSGDAYCLSRTLADGVGQTFLLDERWSLRRDGQLHCSLQFRNDSRLPVRVPALILSAGDLPPWYRLSGDPYGKTQEIHTVDFCTAENKVDSLAADARDAKFDALNGVPVRWFGVSNRFFAMLLKADTPLALTAERLRESDGKEKSYILSVGGELASFELAPGAARTVELDYFIGPKQPSPLRAFDEKAVKVMRLGWFPIDFLAYIMLALLNWLHGFVGSFGWSIILLTLLVRTIFFPVTMKANASMREMQALGPEVKALREKYKDEPMTAQVKISELYRERHISPVGGCLPMLIQIPVFIALYYALGSAVELRQQGFGWIRDLSQPDTVATVFGIGIHPLIIVWTGLMIVQQKLTPTAMEPMQAKMMMVMPLVMLFFLYDLPSALTLYWAVSQVFSIVQMRYQQRVKKREEQTKQEAGQGSPGKKPRIVRS